MPEGMHKETHLLHIKKVWARCRTENFVIQSQFLSGRRHISAWKFPGAHQAPLHIQVERGVMVPDRFRITSHWVDLVRRVFGKNVPDFPLRKVKNIPTCLHPGDVQTTSSGIIITDSHLAAYVNNSGIRWVFICNIQNRTSNCKEMAFSSFLK